MCHPDRLSHLFVPALSYIETGEFPELFHLRVQMLMQSGCEDFALNLCNWCTQAEKFQYDPYIRGVQLVLLFDRGFLDIMNEEVRFSVIMYFYIPRD